MWPFKKKEPEVLVEFPVVKRKKVLPDEYGNVFCDNCFYHEFARIENISPIQEDWCVMNDDETYTSPINGQTRNKLKIVKCYDKNLECRCVDYVPLGEDDE